MVRSSLVLCLVVLAFGLACGGGTEPFLDDSTTAPATPTARPVATEPGSTSSPNALGMTLSSGVSIADIVEQALPSVVQVTTSNSTGTGFIIDPSGLVVTNKHVVDGSDRVTLRTESGERHQGRVVRRHATLDLAYIEIDGGRSFTAITLADSDVVRVGEEVIAIGFPIESLLPGLTPTVSIGIVSARRLDYLQTDAAINPGNSGGPLLNAAGQVVGVIVSRIETDSSGRQIVGIGFAIPVNEVEGWQVTPSPIRPSTPVATATPGPSPTPGPTPLPSPTPTITPTPTLRPTPTPHPQVFCREWEALVLDWIREGNGYWRFHADRFLSPFADGNEPEDDIPSLPGITAREGDYYCNKTNFPRAMIPTVHGSRTSFSDDALERPHYTPIANIGDGGHEYLPGTYEYRWEGGTLVEATCSIWLNASVTKEQRDGLTYITYSYGRSAVLTVGEPFTIRLTESDGPVNFKTVGGHCEGTLYWIGE